ncbi:MAG: shikimate kinase [Calditrichaceae bacterium]
MKNHLFLTGFMGAGKSKIGPLLADQFGCPFYDADSLIEDEAGMVISDIFREFGEPYFRSIESDIISRLVHFKKRSVIALGGGALMKKNSFDLISDNGILIYIKSSPEEIYKRVKDSGKRPLLSVSDDRDQKESMLNRIRSLLTERAPIYEKADIIIDRDPLTLEEIVAEIFNKVNECRIN